MAAVTGERSRLETILSSLTDGVVLTDSKGRILLANSAAERLFSFEQMKVKGIPVIETIYDHEIDDMVKTCLSTSR
ncbi:MAG: PAS domain-containing protein, partial [bacterium]